jgi:hypothetical protein
MPVGGSLESSEAIRREEVDMTRLVALLTGAALSLSIATTRGQAVREWPTYPIKQAPRIAAGHSAR